MQPHYLRFQNIQSTIEFAFVRILALVTVNDVQKESEMSSLRFFFINFFQFLHLHPSNGIGPIVTESHSIKDGDEKIVKN